MISRTSIIPRSALLSLAVIGHAVWPFAPAAAAYLSVTTQASAAAESVSTPPPVTQTMSQFGATGPVQSSVAADQNADGATGNGVASATLDFGFFAATADSQAQVPRGFINSNLQEVNYFAGSYATVTATSVVSSFLVAPANPALGGTLGTMVVPFDVQGTLSATLSPDRPGGAVNATSIAQVLWGMDVGAMTGTMFAFLNGSVDTGSTGSGDMPGPHTLRFDLLLGVPTDLFLNYHLQTNAGITSTLLGGGRIQGLADFASTFRWMGISQVLDAEGNPIEYTVVSDAGIDWTQAAPAPVPVPPLPLSLLTAVLGSGALFARRRGRP